MDGNERGFRPGVRKELAAIFVDRHFTFKDALRGGRAEAQDQVRANGGGFGREPRAACADFRHIRFPVNAALAARLELEVFHGVGNVSIGEGDSGRFKSPGEDLARGADKGMALPIFLIAGLLADDDDAGAARTLAENGLRRVAVKVARLTEARGFTEDAERTRLGDDDGHGYDLPSSSPASVSLM